LGQGEVLKFVVICNVPIFECRHKRPVTGWSLRGTRGFVVISSLYCRSTYTIPERGFHYEMPIMSRFPSVIKIRTQPAVIQESIFCWTVKVKIHRQACSPTWNNGPLVRCQSSIPRLREILRLSPDLIIKEVWPRWFGSSNLPLW
jgi:hypothetical protein